MLLFSDHASFPDAASERGPIVDTCGRADQAPGGAAGWPAMHAGVGRALRTAVDHLIAPRHASMLLYLSLLSWCSWMLGADLHDHVAWQAAAAASP
jgi:hypothetical protein